MGEEKQAFQACRMQFISHIYEGTWHRFQSTAMQAKKIERKFR